MYRYVFVAAVFAVILPSTPSVAVSPKDKMAICVFGADDQKLVGKRRAEFIRRCMSNRNDPRGRGPAAAPGDVSEPEPKV